ncbi:MAG: queuosine precursor transporter [Flavobacteriales bacterium]|nr:queuosine precursor transporter [Flavobacteriales bacterium]
MDRTKQQAHFYYLILAGVFIALLVSCNLIFQKFISWNPFGWYHFEISVGLIPYPFTFLITDIISEIYGRKNANRVVMVGLVATVFVMGVIAVSDLAVATPWSPVSNEEFSKVFGLTGVAVAASMLAYLFAQFIDIRIFHFWKDYTKGKHLWLRNNFSTITSQFVDTATVLLLLCSFGAIEWKLFGMLLLNGFLFKVLVALVDTPFFYLAAWWFKKKLNLAENEEIHF